jgi:hypothetical protein
LFCEFFAPYGDGKRSRENMAQVETAGEIKHYQDEKGFKNTVSQSTKYQILLIYHFSPLKENGFRGLTYAQDQKDI